MWFRNVKVFLKELYLSISYLSKVKLNNIEKSKIVFICDGKIPHGGWVDRLKGIISFYFVAKKLNYRFYIYFVQPFVLDKYLIPNKVNWVLENKSLVYNPITTKILYLNNNFKANPIEIINNSRKEIFFVYCNVDYLKIFIKDKSEQEINNLRKFLFSELFKQSTHLKEMLSPYKSKPYCCIHTRFSSLLGDFEDSTKFKLTKEESKALFMKLQNKVRLIKKKHDCPVYLMSDSKIFLDYISKNNKIKIIMGLPIHMDDFIKEKDIIRHEKTLIDFFVLLFSDKIYFLKTGKMYNSSFSKYASIFGNSDYITLQD